MFEQRMRVREDPHTKFDFDVTFLDAIRSARHRGFHFKVPQIRERHKKVVRADEKYHFQIFYVQTLSTIRRRRLILPCLIFLQTIADV